MASVRLKIWAVCFVAAFFATGPIFGWPALQLMLYDEGIYADLCGDSAANLDCPERAMRMNVVFSSGFFTCFAGRILWGLLLDAKGPRCAATLACLTVGLGALLMALSGRGLDLLPLAAALIGIGGPGVHCSNFHVSNLFPERKRMVTTGFSGIFGTSGLVFVVLRALYAAGVSFRVVFLGYAGLLCLTTLALFAVQSPRVFKLGEQVTAVASWQRQMVAQAKCAAPGVEVPVSFWRKVGQQLASGSGVGVTLFFTIHYVHLQFYLGNAKEMLARMGDDGTYALVFNVLGSSAIVWAPFVGGFLDRVGFDVAFAVCVVFGLLCGLCAQVPGLEPQILTFLFWTLNRLLLFAGYFSFLPATFGFQTFGTLTGVTSAIAAAVGLICIPVSDFAVRKDAHQEVLWVCLAALALSICFPLLLRRWRMQEASVTAATAERKEVTATSHEAACDAQPKQIDLEADRSGGERAANPRSLAQGFKIFVRWLLSIIC